MPPITTRTSPPYFTAPSSPVAERLHFNENTKPKRLSGKARQQFLEKLRDDIKPCVIKIQANHLDLEKDLENFRNSQEFSVLINNTTKALYTLQDLTRDLLGQDQEQKLQEAIGTMLNKMQVPKAKNPWFDHQSQFNQERPILYSQNEVLHAYQNTCREIQILEKLLKAALEEQLGLTKQEAQKEIKPFLSELPALISVCGAGSLINIQDQLANLQHQLLPGSLAEQFDRQTEKVLEQRIQKILAKQYAADPYHAIQEIHRVKAIRYLASQWFDLPEISIDNDIYALGYALDLFSPENRPVLSTIKETLLALEESNFSPEKICLDLALDYTDRFKTHLRSQGVDPEKIPYNSPAIRTAIDLLENAFARPPEQYIFQEVDRSDYSRCAANRPVLLSAWFFHSLKNTHSKIQQKISQMGITSSRQANHNNRTSNRIQPAQNDLVFEIGELRWANSPDPLLGKAEYLTTLHLSEQWQDEHLDPSRIKAQSFNILMEAIFNTANYVLQSTNPDAKVVASFNRARQALAQLGIHDIIKLPLHFIDQDEKFMANAIAHFASLDHPENDILIKFCVDDEIKTLISQDPTEGKKLLVGQAIHDLLAYPELLSKENPFAVKLLSTLFTNKFIRTYEMSRFETLMGWAIHTGHTDLVKLVIETYKTKKSPYEAKEILNGSFMPPLTTAQRTTTIFHQWPTLLERLRTSALGVACISNNLSLLKALLEERLPPNKADSYGHTPLSYAAAYGSKEMVEYLIQHGAHPFGHSNPTQTVNIPPVVAASMAERIDIVETLVQHQADINQTSANNDMTALHTAYLSGNVGLVKKLYELGAKHGSKARLFESSSRSPKRTAFEMLTHVIKNNLDSHSKISRTKENIKLAQVYVLHHIQHGIPFDNTELMHGYPLVHALSHQQNTQALKMLFDSIAEQPELKASLLNGRNSWISNKKTPLMVAAQNGALETAEYLISHPETDLLMTDSKGRTALEIAKAAGQTAMVELLSRQVRIQHDPVRAALLNRAKSTSMFGRFRPS